LPSTRPRIQAFEKKCVRNAITDTMASTAKYEQCAKTSGKRQTKTLSQMLWVMQENSAVMAGLTEISKLSESDNSTVKCANFERIGASVVK